MMPEEKAAGLGTAAASTIDYTRNYTIHAATLLTRLSRELPVIAEYRPLAIDITWRYARPRLAQATSFGAEPFPFTAEAGAILKPWRPAARGTRWTARHAARSPSHSERPPGRSWAEPRRQRSRCRP